MSKAQDQLPINPPYNPRINDAITEHGPPLRVIILVVLALALLVGALVIALGGR